VGRGAGGVLGNLLVIGRGGDVVLHTLLLSFDRAAVFLILALLVFAIFLLPRLVPRGVRRAFEQKKTTYPTLRTAWATGPSRSICSLATRYLATSMRRSFQTSIISS